MNALQSKPIRFRLQVLTAVGVLGLIAMLTLSIVQNNRELNQDIASKIRSQVESGSSVLAYYEGLERSGLLTRAKAQTAAKEALRAVRYDGKNYFFIIDMTPRMVLLPYKPEMEGRELGDYKDPAGMLHYVAMVDLVKRAGEGPLAYHWMKPGSDVVAPKLAYVKGFAPWGWIIGTGAYVDDIQTAEWIMGLKLGGLGALIAALTVALALAVARSITEPLGRVTDRMRGLADGDLETPVPFTELPNELGAMGRAVSVFKDGMVAKATLEQEARWRIAEDRLTAANNARLSIALDRVSLGVMLADAEGFIIYANPFTLGIFRRRLDEIRKDLPTFDADSIIGRSFDQFHRDPKHQRNLLDDLKGTHMADVALGNARLRLVADPVVNDEGVRLGTVVQWMDRTDEAAIEREVERAVTLAVEGDLTVRLDETGKEGFFLTLVGGMNRLIFNTAEVLRTLSGAAVRVGQGADEISRGNANLSQRTAEQASSLEETAASMEEMTSTVKNNADNAAQANQLARAARDHAEQGGAVVHSAVTAMREINASSKRIADIIGVIDAIAFQTNLLALNAAVEAARAGEQGRGFAVVASEVRSLASRSAAAAKEIKGLIQESVTRVDEGTKLVDASGKVLQEIVAQVKRVTDVVAEIAASSAEQATGIEQVNHAVISMDGATQQNAALVEEASAAAQALTDEARSLGDLMARYRVGGESSAAAPAAAPARKAARPQAPSPARARAVPAPAPAPAPKKVAAGGGGADWEQF